jgi:hypothetical protein
MVLDVPARRALEIREMSLEELRNALNASHKTLHWDNAQQCIEYSALLAEQAKRLTGKR